VIARSENKEYILTLVPRLCYDLSPETFFSQEQDLPVDFIHSWITSR
jgi:hypothetical protein